MRGNYAQQQALQRTRQEAARSRLEAHISREKSHDHKYEAKGFDERFTKAQNDLATKIQAGKQLLQRNLTPKDDKVLEAYVALHFFRNPPPKQNTPTQRSIQRFLDHTPENEEKTTYRQKAQDLGAQVRGRSDIVKWRENCFKALEQYHMAKIAKAEVDSYNNSKDRLDGLDDASIRQLTPAGLESHNQTLSSFVTVQRNVKEDKEREQKEKLPETYKKAEESLKAKITITDTPISTDGMQPKSTTAELINQFNHHRELLNAAYRNFKKLPSATHKQEMEKRETALKKANDLLLAQLHKRMQSGAHTVDGSIGNIFTAIQATDKMLHKQSMLEKSRFSGNKFSSTFKKCAELFKGSVCVELDKGGEGFLYHYKQNNRGHWEETAVTDKSGNPIKVTEKSLREALNRLEATKAEDMPEGYKNYTVYYKNRNKLNPFSKGDPSSGIELIRFHGGAEPKNYFLSNFISTPGDEAKASVDGAPETKEAGASLEESSAPRSPSWTDTPTPDTSPSGGSHAATDTAIEKSDDELPSCKA